jgi:hypothetical protein
VVPLPVSLVTDNAHSVDAKSVEALIVVVFPEQSK